MKPYEENLPQDSSSRFSDDGMSIGLDDSITGGADDIVVGADITIDRTDGSINAQPIRVGASAAITPRSYQLEMFEESVKGNVIVAMETGSGKTQVAVLRIQHEIENGDPSKIVWFMAPTVALCAQQFNVLERQISATRIVLFSGADNVDRWSEQSLWDAVLKGVQIVVCTPQILYDALTHGFVKIANISLLVFDEAHNYIGKNPGSMIMTEFYRPNRLGNMPVPSVLGLSASPGGMKSRSFALEKTEETLQSICRSPSLNKADLMTYVNMPELRQVLYDADPLEYYKLHDHTWSLSSLHSAFRNSRIEDDPYVIHLRKNTTERGARSLETALLKGKTYSLDQLKAFYEASLHICHELGPWAADYYIYESISKCKQVYQASHGCHDELANEERKYLLKILQGVTTMLPSESGDSGSLRVNDKVEKFLDSLDMIPPDGNLVGIVFVKRRATAAVLGKLLSIHPRTRDRLKVAVIVGTSQSANRPNALGDLIERFDHADTLEKFRSGQLDLLIATSVLNEGIDVPACNFVLCFDEPDNLKNFVQIRGRARQQLSTLVIMQSSKSEKLDTWERMERQMKEMYADRERKLKEIEHVDASEEMTSREFRVLRTGALLNLDNAVAHLNHFCAVLPSSPFVDRTPEYIFREGDLTRVILPLSVASSMRYFSSIYKWSSEANGRKDAAYEAYLGLYHAGLVNDNLLPLMRHDPADKSVTKDIEKRKSVATVNALWDPWHEIGRLWLLPTAFENLSTTTIKIKDANGAEKRWEMLLPSALPQIPDLNLYWSEKITLRAEFGSSRKIENDVYNHILQARMKTHALHRAAFEHRFEIESCDFVIPFYDPDLKLGFTRLVPVGPDVTTCQPGSLIIRDQRQRNAVYVVEKWLDSKPDAHLLKHIQPSYDDLSEEQPFVILNRVTKRENFLNPMPAEMIGSPSKPYSYALPVSNCVVDGIPFASVQMTMLLPSLTYHIARYLIATELSRTILASVEIVNIDLVVTAITASSANFADDYQRLEFLGDSLLKFCASIQLLALHPLYHEGYLSRAKDHIVANSRLARATVETGLDRFIITKPFVGRKWRPLHVSKVSGVKSELERELSTKVLADVVEALVGAAMVSGGIVSALACISVFLPEIDWQPIATRRDVLFDCAPQGHLMPAMEALERLLGRHFIKPGLLVEAMTHGSCHSGTGSYERLEFLGDALLDHVVTNHLFQFPGLSHVQMHHLRTAFVNADFLAYICMQFAIQEEFGGIVQDQSSEQNGRLTFHEEMIQVKKPLWKFMRHTSMKLAHVQEDIARRFELIHESIDEALRNGNHYPWVLLAQLQAPKFFSDIVEALIAAVYIDSGSIEAVESLLSRMGILEHLQRALEMGDQLNVCHPKEELGILADTETVTYIVKNNKRIDEAVEKYEWTCEVLVGERRICLVGGGLSKMEIKAKAAEEAVRLIKEERAAILISADTMPVVKEAGSLSMKSK